MRGRSPSWQTVTLPKAVFRALVRPLSHFTRAPAGAAPCAAGAGPDEECPF